MTDYLTTDTELTSIANAIRTKGGTAANLTYPTGFVSAINAIPTGGGSANIEALSVTQNGTYTAGGGVDGYSPVTVSVSGGGVDARWWGGIEPELIGETLWSKSPTEAANWPITPSTSNKNLTWTSEYTANAGTYVIIDRIGKGYHGVTETLDFGTYNYIWVQNAYMHLAYTVDEATISNAHMMHQGVTALHHFGASPTITRGQIIRPSTTQYGVYSHIAVTAPQSLYRDSIGQLGLLGSCTYGIGASVSTLYMDTTSSVTPEYFNVRIPTFSIRGHTSFMAVDAYNYLDWEDTTINYRSRIYRVPVEYGLYTQINDRNLDMILDEAFPTY